MFSSPTACVQFPQKMRENQEAPRQNQDFRIRTIRFFLRIMCALTISSMCVVNSFIFSRGMILKATKLFLFFQRNKRKSASQNTLTSQPKHPPQRQGRQRAGSSSARNQPKIFQLTFSYVILQDNADRVASLSNQLVICCTLL